MTRARSASSRVATRVSWSPLSGLKGVQPPLPFGESEARGRGWEDQPHVQGAVAARVQEGVAGVPVPGEAIDQMGSKEPLPLEASRSPLGFHITFPGWWRWECGESLPFCPTLFTPGPSRALGWGGGRWEGPSELPERRSSSSAPRRDGSLHTPGP